MEPNRLLTIGGLSQRTGVHIETIRYYERIGLLPRPARSEGGHRVYAEDSQQRLLFVRRARELGFPLNEVRALLGLTRRHSPCTAVKTITERHIAEIRSRINDLKRLERALGTMVTQCRGGDTSDCPILDALAGGSDLACRGA